MRTGVSTSLTWYMITGILLLALLVQGCAGSTRRVRREKLSEAMEKASDDYEGEREISPPMYVEEEEKEDRIISVEIIQPDYEEDDGDRVSHLREEARDTLREQPSPPPSSREPYFKAPVFTMTGGTGVMKSDDFYGIHTFALGIGGYFGEYNRGEIVLGGGWSSVQETSTLNNSLDEGVLLLNAGLQYKRFTTPRHTLLGHYFLLGIGYTWMYWGYENPIYDGYDQIRSDSLSGLELSGGMGFNLLQTNSFQLGGELVPSVILWWFDTSKGFENDVFDPFLMLKFRVTVSSVPSL